VVVCALPSSDSDSGSESGAGPVAARAVDPVAVNGSIDSPVNRIGAAVRRTCSGAHRLTSGEAAAPKCAGAAAR
jgi:hypothetical protein